MTRFVLPWIVLLGGSLALVTPPARSYPVMHQAEEKVTAGDDALVGKVRKAIDEGVSFLRARQRKDNGSWEVANIPSQEGGQTALVMLALINSGVKPNDPAIERGMAYLRGIKPSRNYVVSLQTMVFCLVRDPQDRKSIQDNVKWLLDKRLADGWDYPNSGKADSSNTQYSLLALHEAIQAGYAVDPKALEAVQKYFIKTQINGGWSYSRTEKNATLTMTTAGLCNLLITGMDLARGEAKLQKDGSADKCGEYTDTPSVKKALDWIGDGFPASITKANAIERLGHPFYCLYGIERAGRISGQRYFGGHDWYEVGCRYLVDVQQGDGSWTADGGLDRWHVVATSFSLLFLSRGRTPVLISKLAYGAKDSSGWNNKRSDMKHLVEFASKELFKGEPLAWQAFDVRNVAADNEASRQQLAAQLLQSPIVFFNGHHTAPRNKEAEILREYVANGGFILAEACCGRKDFDTDFRKLMLDLFPDSKLEPLDKDHPVWLASGKFGLTPRDFPLEGIKMGCKTVVIYSPKPISGYWEADLKADKDRGQKAFEMGANIIAYATGLEAPRARGRAVEINRDGPKESPKRGYLTVGQLKYEGDWQPAPKAMRNLMIEARKAGLDVVYKTKPVGMFGEDVIDYRFLYMHGRTKFEAKKEDLKSLHFCLTSGGALFADACCGSKVFDESFRAFMVELFGDDKLKLEKIPLDDPLYAADLNGTAIRQVRRRDYGADGKRVEPQPKSAPPDLEGIKFDGRWVVIYSKYDIGCALEKHSSPECRGHDPASALRLARAALLYSLRR